MVLYFVLLVGVLNASVIIGAYKLSSKGYLFYSVRLIFEKIVYYNFDEIKINYVLEFFYRPVLGCVICMNSLWSVGMLFIYSYLDVINLQSFAMKDLISYILSIFVSVTICTYYEDKLNIQYDKSDSVQIS